MDIDFEKLLTWRNWKDETKQCRIKRYNLAGALQRKCNVSLIISSEIMLVSAKKVLYAHWISANYESLPNGLRIYATILFWLLLNILEMRFAHLHQNYRALVSKSTRNSRKKHYNSLMTMKFSKIFMFSIFAIFLFTVTLSSAESSDSEETHGIHVASWNWDHVGVFITITAFIVFSGLAKVGRFYMFILFMYLWFKYYYY